MDGTTLIPTKIECVLKGRNWAWARVLPLQTKARNSQLNTTSRDMEVYLEAVAAKVLGVMPMPGSRAFSRTTPKKDKTPYPFPAEILLVVWNLKV